MTPSPRDDKYRDERLRAIVDTVIDGIVTIDSAGLIETFNPAAERIFGYTENEALGRPVGMLMPAPHRDEHQDYVSNYLRTGEAKIIGIGREVRGRRKDGTTFPMDLAVSELADLGVFVGVVRDLTDRQRRDEQLRQADRLASIGSLAAGLGHDMNNVLLPIRSHLDVLDAADLSHDLHGHVRSLRDSVAYLQQLTDGLHLLALDPEDTEASGETTDVAQWWDQVGPLLQRSLPSSVRLASEMPTDLPPAAVPPHRLTQVALNLLVNAGDAVDEEGRVRISAALTDDGRIRLIVTDDGVGMPPEVRARALEPFFTTKKRGLGTGLGLALVRGIVTSAGGTVGIESEPGGGTTVNLDLPAAPSDRARDTARRSAPALEAVVSLDDDRIATLISSMLEEEGFRVRLEPSADPATSALWITSPADTAVSAVQRFLQAPGRQVIACGPRSRAWRRVGALVIEDLMDFDVIREAIGEALQGIGPISEDG
jgi:PAS domain S-box-containing protein